MNSITISEGVFKTILLTLKDGVAKDNYRPELQYIRLDVKSDRIIGYSLDGYRAGRIIIPCKEPNKSEFTAYIKPVPFKNSKTGDRTVTITLDNLLATVEFEQDIGVICYSFEQPEAWQLKMESLWDNAKKHDRGIGVNAYYLSRACAALVAAGCDKNNLSVLESKESKLEPFCIRADDAGGIQLDQLILPIRFES